MAVTVSVRGLREVQRALTKLPADARAELTVGQHKLAETFVRLTRAAGRADSRQSARAAATVRVSPTGVTAGPHPLLYGSEFGATRRFGWYAAARYRRSSGRQFRPHRGGSSYWFFRAVEQNQGVIDRETDQVGDRVIGRWSA